MHFASFSCFLSLSLTLSLLLLPFISCSLHIPIYSMPFLCLLCFVSCLYPQSEFYLSSRTKSECLGTPLAQFGPNWQRFVSNKNGSNDFDETSYGPPSKLGPTFDDVTDPRKTHYDVIIGAENGVILNRWSDMVV